MEIMEDMPRMESLSPGLSPSATVEHQSSRMVSKFERNYEYLWKLEIIV
jgi:hypothetical protein